MGKQAALWVEDKPEWIAGLGMAACVVMAVTVRDPLLDLAVPWQAAAWYGFWLAVAALYAYAFMLARKQDRRSEEPPQIGNGRAQEMGQDLKEMYEAISISLQQAQDAKDALLQFCASNGYRALRKGGEFFVQDMRSGRVYRAEFQSYTR